MHIMRCSDSCKVYEIDYDTAGRITEQFYCDYNKPNDCYTKDYYPGGKIADETIYTPRNYYKYPIDTTFINSFSATNRVIPLKFIEYDENGKIAREIDLEEVRKKLQKKQ